MDVKIKFHPLFIVFGFLLIFFGWLELFLTYFLVMILHEYGHYFVARILGYKLNKIVFMPYGVSLNGQGNIFKRKDEILIALAGPLVNFFLAFLFIGLWWIFPLTYAYTFNFVLSNICLGLFNLIPIFPLDGGRLFVALLSNKIKRYKIVKGMKILSIIGSVSFLILFFISVFSQLNLTYFFISFFLMSSCFDGKNNYFYERCYLFSKDVNNKPIEIKTYIVNKAVPITSLTKYLTGNFFVNFHVVDDNMKLIKVLTENDVLNLLTKTEGKIDKDGLK